MRHFAASAAVAGSSSSSSSSSSSLEQFLPAWPDASPLSPGAPVAAMAALRCARASAACESFPLLPPFALLEIEFALFSIPARSFLRCSAMGSKSGLLSLLPVESASSTKPIPPARAPAATSTGPIGFRWGNGTPFLGTDASCFARLRRGSAAAASAADEATESDDIMLGLPALALFVLPFGRPRARFAGSAAVRRSSAELSCSLYSSSLLTTPAGLTTDTAPERAMG